MTMDRKIFFKPVLFLMLFIYGLQLLAERFGWYDSHWWFDIPMHFLGGFWVGIFFFWFFSYAEVPFVRQPVRAITGQTLMHAIFFLILVSLAWEAGEFLTTNHIGLALWSMSDTAGDIFFDLAGGAAALFYCFRKIMTPRFFKVQSS